MRAPEDPEQRDCESAPREWPFFASSANDQLSHLVRASDTYRIEAIILTDREPRAKWEWGKAAFCTAPRYGDIGPRQIEWNMNAFDLEYGACNAVSAAGLKAESPLVVTADMEAFVLYEITDRALALEHDTV